MGAYDRWELKLGKKTTSQTSPLVKEWADMVLFANYKTFSVAVDDKGKKHKAQGGARVMYTAHHPCWDAKNRYGFPGEMPFDYAGIAHVIEGFQAKQEPSKEKKSEKQPQESFADRSMDIPEETKQDENNLTDNKPGKEDSPKLFIDSDPSNIPQALKDLMAGNNVTEWDIQNVVAAKGYYPSDTPVEKYDAGFIQGVLVGAWPKVYGMIQAMKEKQEIPFN